jgi:hypothetical protein
MPITYTIDQQQKIIFTKWDGVIDATEISRHWTELLADTMALEIRTSIADIRSTDLQFTGDELHTIVLTQVIPALKGRDWTCAIVVAKPVQYGTSRQYQVFAQSYSSDNIFFDYEAGLAWLKTKQ